MIKKINFIYFSLFLCIAHQNVFSGNISSTVVYFDYDDFEIRSLDVVSLFLQAIADHDTDIITTLLSKQPELVDCKDVDGLTPLHHALNSPEENPYKINSKVIETLINYGADIKAEDSHGITPEEIAEAYKRRATQDFDISEDDFREVEKMYQAISPDKPQFRKRSHS